MKKFLIVLSLLFLTACSNETSKFKKEYETLNDSSVVVTIDKKATIKYLKVEEVVDFLENKTGIIYFGFPSCPWCRNILPVLIDVAKENNQTIYYFNPKELRGSNDENFARIMTILNDYLNSNAEGEKVLYVPDVYFVKEGVIMAHHLGSVSSQKDPYVTLTLEQKEELKNIYQESLDKIK